jgi:hypothetical protein
MPLDVLEYCAKGGFGMQSPAAAGVQAVSADTVDLLRDYACIVADILGAADDG